MVKERIQYAVQYTGYRRPRAPPQINADSECEQRTRPGEREHTPMDAENVLIDGQANAGPCPAFAVLIPPDP